MTIRVFWKNKFNGDVVAIEAADFNPSLHRHEAEGPWKQPQPEAAPTIEQAEAVEIAAPVEATAATIEEKPKTKGFGLKSKK